MRVEELTASFRDSLEARMVYAAPYEKDGVTVIAAARVAGGGGGGTGRDRHGLEGDGGGFGMTARPSGAFVITDGAVRWEPAVDVNRVVGTVGAVVVATLLVVGRILRQRG
jgi:uncharacterized spore protein YtfJ